MIAILLATYNGEKYISAQLDSILNQTIKDFTLWISDDFSTDSTIDILQEYKTKHPDKIMLSIRTKNSGNSKHNFLDMMTSIKDDCVMLCDQDDIWLPNKIELTLAKMKEVEKQHPGQAVLIRTDMKVVDENLKIISPSYKQSMNSNFDRTSFNQILIQNTFAGCTAMYNRKLAELINQKPNYCIMHDWWLELVASAFGKISHVDEQTMLYRQHGNNVIGAKDVRKLGYKINRLLNNEEVKNAINITYTQAKSFLECYEQRMDEKQINIIKQYIQIPNMKRLDKWKTICTLGTYKNGLSRNIAYFMFV